LKNNENLPYDFYGKKIWMLMNIELWYQNVCD
jgi:asparagine synthase (glutamine-hydrolysing)